MTAAHLSRVELTTLAPAAGFLGRVEVGTPDPCAGWLGRVEVTVPLALTANAGADVGDVEPYSLGALVGTVTGGAAQTHSWRQVSGPASPITDPTAAVTTFKAPGTLAGAVCVFGYTVIGTNDVPSPESATRRTVFPVTERAVIGGVEVPVEISLVSND